MKNAREHAKKLLAPLTQGRIIRPIGLDGKRPEGRNAVPFGVMTDPLGDES